jgi:hypothetical protein
MPVFDRDEVMVARGRVEQEGNICRRIGAMLVVDDKRLQRNVVGPRKERRSERGDD